MKSYCLENDNLLEAKWFYMCILRLYILLSIYRGYVIMLGNRTRRDLSKLQIHSYNLCHEINYMNVSMIYCFIAHDYI